MYYGPNSDPYSYRKPTFGSNLKNFITSKSTLNRLIVINVAVYLAFLIVRWILSLFGFLMNSPGLETSLQLILNQLACPASFAQLLYQPWSLVTSLFLHADFFHILMNMLMLYVTGRIFTQYLDNRKLLITYFAGGITGNLLYMISFTVFPVFQSALPFSHALGASGSIMAIMAAITMYRPHHELHLFIFGRVKLYWIMIAFIVIDIISIPQSNAGGHIAHLGGVFYGVISQFFYRYYPSVSQAGSSRKSANKKGKKQKFSTSYDSNWRPMTDEEYNARKMKEQQKIDEILDKISKSGYDALTKEEKDFLFHYSKK